MSSNPFLMLPFGVNIGAMLNAKAHANANTCVDKCKQTFDIHNTNAFFSLLEILTETGGTFCCKCYLTFII